MLICSVSAFSQLNDYYYSDRNLELYNPAISTNGSILVSVYNKHRIRRLTYNASAIILGISADSSNFTGLLTYMGSYDPNYFKNFSFNGGLSYKFKNLSFGANAGMIYSRVLYNQIVIDLSDPVEPSHVSDMALDINAGIQYSSYLNNDKINHLKVHISYNHLNTPTVFDNTYLVNESSFNPLLKTGVSFRHVVISKVLDVKFSYNGFYTNRSQHSLSFTDIYKEVLELGGGYCSNSAAFFRLGLNLNHLHIRLVYFTKFPVSTTNNFFVGKGFEENFLIYTGSDDFFN